MDDRDRHRAQSRNVQPGRRHGYHDGGSGSVEHQDVEREVQERDGEGQGGGTTHDPIPVTRGQGGEARLPLGQWCFAGGGYLVIGFKGSALSEVCAPLRWPACLLFGSSWASSRSSFS